MKTYIRRQQHKSIKHQDMKQKEPPQKYGVLYGNTLATHKNNIVLV